MKLGKKAYYVRDVPESMGSWEYELMRNVPHKLVYLKSASLWWFWFGGYGALEVIALLEEVY